MRDGNAYQAEGQRKQLVQRLREPGFLGPVSAFFPRARFVTKPVTQVLTACDGEGVSLWQGEEAWEEKRKEERAAQQEEG